jgi:WD40 repeat protein
MACYESGAIYVGNTDSGEMTLFGPPVDRITGSANRIVALEFSLDYRHLLCADYQGIVYSTEWSNCFWTARPPIEPIDEDLISSTATFSSSGSHCVFTFRDNRQHLSWTPQQRSKCLLVLRHAESGATLQLLHERDDDTHEPSNSQFTPDARHVFQAYGSSIFVWDVLRQTLHTKMLAMNEGTDWSMPIQRLTAVSNTVFASLSLIGTIALWDLVQGVHLRTITQGSIERSQHVFGLTCSSDGSLLGVVFENIMKVVNVADSHIIAEHTLPPARKTWTRNAGIGMDASRARLVMAGTGHPISIWNYKLVNHTWRNASPTSSQGHVSCTAFSADGSLLVSGTEDGSMTIWRTESGLPIARYTGEGVMTAVSLSGPCSKFIFSSRNLGVDPALDRWERSSVFQLSDRTTGDILLSREHRPNPEVHAATLSPDDMYLALWLAHSKDLLEAPITSTFVLENRTGKTVASSESSGTNEQLASDPEGQAYTPDGLNLVQTCFGSITVRDALNLKIRYTLSYNENPSQAGFTIVSPCSTRVGRISPINGYRLRLRVWGLQSGLILMETHLGEEFERNSRWWGHLKPVWTQSQLLYASRNGISIWDFDESEPPTVHLWDPALKPKYICSSPDGSFIYAWCEDEHIRVWATTDGFILPRPILKLTASLWPEEVKRALSSPGPLIIFHDENVLQVLAPTEPGRRYLCVVVDLSDGSCVRVTPFGDGQEWERPSLLKVTTDNRLYMLSPADTIVSLVSRLAHVSFHENDAHVAEADWVVMVNDTFEKLERALLQVWNLETGELEATVVWSGTTVEIEEIPHTFVLRRSHPADTLDEGLIYAHYSSHDAWLRVYTGSLSAELFWRLGIPSDMRPSFPTSSETNISTYGSRVAMGSANGTVNIFDFAKALHAVEVRKGTGREPIEAAVKGWQW